MVRTLRVRSAATILTTGLLLALSGCGGADDTVAREGAAGTETSGSPAPSPDPAASSDAAGEQRGPACDDVWRDGATLPRRYTGCLDSGGAWVAAEKRECSLGIPLVTYDDAFYAVPGGPVNPTQGSLESDRDYRSALASCTA